MKKNFCIKLLTLMCLFLTFNSCSETIVAHLSESADLTVANITTGEQMENGGIQIGINRLIAHPGDVLRISYNKPEGYEQYIWEVTIDIFGEEITGETPFTTEYTVKESDEGEQSISCRGVINDSDVDEFSGSDYGIVYIEVVNE